VTDTRQRQERTPAKRQQSQPPAKAQQSQMPAAAGNHTSEKLVGRLAQRYGVPANTLLGVLRDTVFKPPKGEAAFSDVELAAALVLAEKYDLNPFAREIYVTRHRGALLVIVPIDGWAKIANAQEAYDGCEFDYENDSQGEIYSTTCRIYRKDRSRPTEVTEFYEECFDPKSDSPRDPWRKWGRRMLRHKAYIQAVRLAFSLSEAVDDDEAARMGVRTPEYSVRDGNREIAAPAPAPAPARRKPPREVQAAAPEPGPEPAAAEEGTEPEGESEETKAAKKKLVAEWKSIVPRLDGLEANEAREAAGVDMIHEFCSLEQLETAVRKAEEIAEGKRQ